MVPLVNGRVFGFGMHLNALNAASFAPDIGKDGGRSAAVLKVQVLLDRAHFSPAVIDGKAGENSTRAIQAYQQSRGLSADGELTEESWRRLNAEQGPVLRGCHSNQ